MQSHTENDLIRLLKAQPGAPEGAACARYLHQLDNGGQDWELFLYVSESLVQRHMRLVYTLSSYTDFTPDELINEFRLRLYAHWVEDYLDQELVKSDPRSFEMFLCDRFHDYLWGFSKKETHRQEIVEVEFPIRQVNGSVRSPVTGAKIALCVGNDSLGPVAPLWTTASLTPESLVDLRETVQSLSGQLWQIARLLLKGWTQKEIAELLQTSEATVSRRVSALRKEFSQEKQVYHKKSNNRESTPQKGGERL